MNLETRKYSLINWIKKLQNEDLIEYLELLRNENVETWEDLPLDLQKGIAESLKQAEDGLVIEHQVQEKRYNKYLK